MSTVSSLKVMLVNMAVFQVFWFVAVLGGNWWAVPAAILGLVVHAVATQCPPSEWKMLGAVAVFGFIVDFVAMQLGLVVFRQSTVVPPLWLILMWVMFATTLNYSLSWLKSRLLVACVLGAVGGAIGYVAGAKLGAGEMSRGTLLFGLYYAFIWGTFLPVALYVGSRKDGTVQ